VAEQGTNVIIPKCDRKIVPVDYMYISMANSAGRLTFVYPATTVPFYLTAENHYTK
jgi:hypothetical protein